mmetsp:Transcript_28918/g.93231  ORF Transcript_28918/g.93231 Transcript_28918/m.93231 type:complete len:213 (+) Transcript_28918:181-819(+)
MIIFEEGEGEADIDDGLGVEVAALEDDADVVAGGELEGEDVAVDDVGRGADFDEAVDAEDVAGSGALGDVDVDEAGGAEAGDLDGKVAAGGDALGKCHARRVDGLVFVGAGLELLAELVLLVLLLPCEGFFFVAPLLFDAIADAGLDGADAARRFVDVVSHLPFSWDQRNVPVREHLQTGLLQFDGVVGPQGLRRDALVDRLVIRVRKLRRI